METDSKKTDIAVAVIKGVVGMAPVVGPLVAEIVGTLIPNQRIDRLTEFVKVLNDKVEQLDQERVRARFLESGFIDLLQDGFYQAARALTPERLEYIASLMKNSLSEEDTKAIQQKKLLSLLGDLNDIEVILLRSYARHPDNDNEFQERHQGILAPRQAYIGAPKEESEEATMFDSYKEHLVRLGLVQNHFVTPSKGALPEFDEKTGMVKTSYRDLTPLGRMLLKYVDLA